MKKIMGEKFVKIKQSIQRKFPPELQNIETLKNISKLGTFLRSNS